jgi:hypothetical protein
MRFIRPSNSTSIRTAASARRRGIGAAALVAGLMIGGVAGTALAQGDVIGAPAPAPVCNPVSALSYKGDATTVTGAPVGSKTIFAAAVPKKV